MASQRRGTEDPTIAIVGDGAGALITLAALAQSGLPGQAMTIYGDSTHPLSNLRCHANALGQQHMRSESSGHLAPVDFPGMAWVDACKQRSLWPLLASLCDRYNPPLTLLLAQADELIERLGFYERKVPVRVAQILRPEDAEPIWMLYDSAGRIAGTANHVILALGHAGLAWPETMHPWRSHDKVMHAYEAPTIEAGERVAVVGGGMAAAHLWSLSLRRGAQVTALHRRPLHRQRLNAPRSAFGAVGIDAYRRLPPAKRLDILRELGHGSFPWRFSWEHQWRRERERDQFRTIQSEMVQMELVRQGATDALALHLQTGETIEVDKLVCATGFVTTTLSYPLIAQLAAIHDLATIDGLLAVSDDFTLPPLSRENSIFGIVGALARWALPVADTFAGIKYAARRLAPQLLS